MSDICVVIPMFGKAEYTDKCVELTLKNAGVDVSILVVDDGSPEPYENEWVKTIRLKENVGFTGAVNAGIIHAIKMGYEYIHVLNNDTEPYPDFIKELFDVMRYDPEIGIAQSIRKNNKDARYCWELFASDLLRGSQRITDDTDNLPEVIPVNWVPLCSTLIRADMIYEIGTLDKKMINWCSDNDFCIRAIFADWKVVVVPASKVFHHHQVTTGPTLYGDRAQGVFDDQREFLKKLSGFHYAELMAIMPLDEGKKTFGKLMFEVEER